MAKIKSVFGIQIEWKLFKLFYYVIYVLIESKTLKEYLAV